MRHETAKRNGGRDGGSERWKRSGNKKKERGEMGLGGFSVVSRRAPRVHVFMCLRGR